MPIDNFEYSHPNGWEDTSNFPTTPASEPQARQLLQEQHKEVRDYIKNTLVPQINLAINNIAADSTLRHRMYMEV